jgi:hypothetical protein
LFHKLLVYCFFSRRGNRANAYGTQDEVEEKASATNDKLIGWSNETQRSGNHSLSFFACLCDARTQIGAFSPAEP